MVEYLISASSSATSSTTAACSWFSSRDGADRDTVIAAAALIRRLLHAEQDLALAQRDAELLVCLQNLGIDLIQRLGARLFLGSGVVIEILIIDGSVMDA